MCGSLPAVAGRSSGREAVQLVQCGRLSLQIRQHFPAEGQFVKQPATAAGRPATAAPHPDPTKARA